MALNVIRALPLKITIVGCGDVGTRCARLLLAQGHEVTGARRNIARLPDWLPGATVDVLNADSLVQLFSTSAAPPDVVIYSLAASGFDEQAYIDAYVTGVQNTLTSLCKLPLRRFIFVSSTGVYHQNDGSVVDETSPTEPVRFNGRRVLQGEQLVRAYQHGTCVRFSGIYGPDRLRLVNRVASGQATLDPGAPYTNRIHIEDCAAVLAHLVDLIGQHRDVDPLYLATDCLPATSAEVESFIATELGLSLDQCTPVPQSKRIAGSKRCSNQRLLDTGYSFKYPDYRAGYRQVIAAMRSSAVDNQ